MRAIALGLVGVGVLGACGSSGRRSAPAPATSTTVGGSSPSTPVDVPSSTPTTSGRVWWTYGGDTTRSGVATDGPADPRGIHRLWTSPTLDGDVYAQPLIVGGRVFVATEHDTVYALNATDGTIVWQRHAGTPVPAASLPCGNVDPVGVTSTPVVDVASGRLYVVGLVEPIEHVLFELDTTNGAIVRSLRVDAPGADPGAQNQRAALTLANGRLYIPYGGRFGDCGDYHGRIVSLSIANGRFGAVTAYTLPTQGRGGFWAPPGPAVTNDGSLFLASGNSTSTNSYDYGNSVVHLSPALRLLDAWAPTDWKALNAADTDIGSTSPVLLATNRVFQIGKGGTGYLLDGTHLGGIGGELHAAPVCSGEGAYGAVAHDRNTLYVPCTNALVRVSVADTTFTVDWTAAASTPGPPVIDDGTVWTVGTSDGVLDAFDTATGKRVVSETIGDLPSRFTAPAIGDRRILVAAARTVMAFGS